MTETPSQFGRHLIVAGAIGLLAPFTGFAWPFAIATGIVIGRADVEKAHNGTTPPSTRIVRVAAVSGGVLAMLIAGAVFGGIAGAVFGLVVGFFVAALCAFSERIAADASPTDQILARILLVIGGAVGWIVIGVALGLHLTVGFGS